MQGPPLSATDEEHDNAHEQIGHDRGYDLADRRADDHGHGQSERVGLSPGPPWGYRCGCGRSGRAELMSDSARMNTWLHKTVLARIAANGGNVPRELLD